MNFMYIECRSNNDPFFKQLINLELIVSIEGGISEEGRELTILHSEEREIVVPIALEEFIQNFSQHRKECDDKINFTTSTVH